MNVMITQITNNPLEAIYRAYRICYSKDKPTEIKIPDSDNMIEFIKDKINLGHYSPLEHISITFAIEGVSRALSHQLVRHRTGKFSQQSQRYVELKQFEYVLPPSIGCDEKTKKIYEEAMEGSQRTYELLVLMLVSRYINNGFSAKDARKKAIEDARYVFPNACETNLICTMDLRNFTRSFLPERLCTTAQWEIREMAQSMRDAVKEFIPFVDYKVMKCGNCPKKCGE